MEWHRAERIWNTCFTLENTVHCYGTGTDGTAGGRGLCRNIFGRALWIIAYLKKHSESYGQSDPYYCSKLSACHVSSLGILSLVSTALTTTVVISIGNSRHASHFLTFLRTHLPIVSASINGHTFQRPSVGTMLSRYRAVVFVLLAGRAFGGPPPGGPGDFVAACLPINSLQFRRRPTVNRPSRRFCGKLPQTCS